MITIKDLKLVNAHLGHPHRYWNPKMRPYIETTRAMMVNGHMRVLDILSLPLIVKHITQVADYLKKLAQQPLHKILFVGTKFPAKWAVKDAATRLGTFYVTERWLGGTLTNFVTIKKRINRLFEIRQMIDVGKFDLMPKMEQEQLLVEQKQLNHLLSGIETMKELPDCIFLVNGVYESKVIKEAQKLHIPLIGFCDTDGDPDVFEAFVPLNDDYFRPIELVLQYLVEQYATAAGLTLPPPTPKPESEINRDMQLKSRRNIARRSRRRVRDLRRFSNVKSNNIIVTGMNYRTVTANGRTTTTAAQADEQLVDLTGRNIYLYDHACEEYFVTGYARRFAVPDDFSRTKEE